MEEIRGDDFTQQAQLHRRMTPARFRNGQLAISEAGEVSSVLKMEQRSSLTIVSLINVPPTDGVSCEVCNGYGNIEPVKRRQFFIALVNLNAGCGQDDIQWIAVLVGDAFERDRTTSTDFHEPAGALLQLSELEAFVIERLKALVGYDAGFQKFGRYGSKRFSCAFCGEQRHRASRLPAAASNRLDQWFV